ncbi:hypothetical protein HDV01_000216 [Terramyces sp. JEL0728]|nr:hypothetical protein HDV01_000216 [Terramyces sp. JEL0728]
MRLDKDAAFDPDNRTTNFTRETKLSLIHRADITSTMIPEILDLKNIGVANLFVHNIALVSLAQFSKLYIAEIDKQRSFALKFTIKSNENEFQVVTKEIKVISKPPTMIPQRDICTKELKVDGIYSGDYISLFNRINCQSGSTRFLDVANNLFTCHDLKWGLFRIWLKSDLLPLMNQLQISLDATLPELLLCTLREDQLLLVSEFLRNKSHSKTELIEYGDLVVLEHVESGILSVTFKVETTEDGSQKGCKKYKKERRFFAGKQAVDTPISQLQKIALSVSTFPDHFLCHQDKEVLLYTSSFADQRFGLIEPYVETVSFKLPPGFLTAGFNGIRPLPRFSGIEVARNQVKLHGDMFAGDFWIYFGVVPARNVKFTDKIVTVQLMEGFKAYWSAQYSTIMDDSLLDEKVPVLMACESGIVFHTGFDLILTFN